MKGTHIAALVGLIGLVGGLGAPAVASVPVPFLTIVHQTRGCHAWSLDHGANRVSETIRLAPGGSIVVTNDDVMPHLLVKTGGPAVAYKRVSAGAPMRLLRVYPPEMLARMGASSSITFPRPGVYRFTTKPGDAQMPDLPTVGPDNVLRLTVRVSPNP
jgi:hypothetical protein